mgnify:CR=1 FL=1
MSCNQPTTMYKLHVCSFCNANSLWILTVYLYTTCLADFLVFFWWNGSKSWFVWECSECQTEHSILSIIVQGWSVMGIPRPPTPYLLYPGTENTWHATKYDVFYQGGFDCSDFMLLKLFTWKLISEAKSWRVNQFKVMGWVFVNKSTWYVLVQCPGKTTPMCVHGNCKQDSSGGNSHSSNPSWPVSDNSQHPTIHYKVKTVRSRHNI